MAAHRAALRVSLYSRTNVGEVYSDLLSGLPCDRGAGHAFFGAVHEQYGGSRHYLCGISGGSVSLDTAGTGTDVAAALSDADAGADQFQYGRSQAASCIRSGADAAAERGMVIFGIIGHSGRGCEEPLQTDGNRVNRENVKIYLDTK